MSSFGASNTLLFQRRSLACHVYSRGMSRYRSVLTRKCIFFIEFKICCQVCTPGGVPVQKCTHKCIFFIEFKKCCQMSTFSLLYSLDAIFLVISIKAHCLLSWKMHLQSEHTRFSRRQFVTMGSVTGFCTGNVPPVLELFDFVLGLSSLFGLLLSPHPSTATTALSGPL